MVRYFFDIHRTTHRFLIQPISYTSHLKVKLVKRFTQFCKTLSTCDKPQLKYLSKIQQTDYRSVFGRNVRNICEEAKVSTLDEVFISNISYMPTPRDEEWRIPLVIELLELKAGRLNSNLTIQEIETILNDTCSN